MSAAYAAERVLQQFKAEQIEFVDLRFTDTRGKEQHVTIPVNQIAQEFFEDGKAFDGSSISGWARIDKSDLLLMPDPETIFLDPFLQVKTMVIRCDIVDPATLQGYARDPRTLAKRAEEFLVNCGIASEAYIGPEPEFFVFDNVQWDVGMKGAFYAVDAVDASWNTGQHYQTGNLGHRPKIKGGYFPVPPVDSCAELRGEISKILSSDLGIEVEAHHHEVASAQHEIATRFNTLVKKSDELQVYKYVVLNAAHRAGKTATFMPKPVYGDNGSGMHVHVSLAKDGKNIFAGDKYAGLSDEALYFIGGIIRHARSLNAFTNPSTNSYKRLVPGFEAPVLLAYSARNRSAAIRVPYVSDPRARRIEVRFPDPMANPYLAFSAMILAGLDGIKHKMHPGEPMEKDLYDLPPEEQKDLDTVCGSLDEALEALKGDHQYLLEGEVFTQDLLESYIKLKQEEVNQVRIAPHPVEFDLYYSQ